MICNGNAHGDGAALAIYLLDNQENEHAEIIEMDYGDGVDLDHTLRSFHAQAVRTRGCTKPLYHGQIRAAAWEELTPEQIKATVDQFEKEMGFQGCPRVVVEHTKRLPMSDYSPEEQAKIREKFGLSQDAATFLHKHQHVVWQRIDPETGRARPYWKDYDKHEAVARKMEQRFGLEKVMGRFRDEHGEPIAKDGTRHRSANPRKQWEIEQEKATGKKKRDRVDIITGLWERTDTGRSLRSALEESGYTLAQGDRRGYVVVDGDGNVHSLAKCIRGGRAAAVAARMADVSLTSLPTVAEIKKGQDQARVDRAREAFGEHIATLIRSEDPGREEPPQQRPQARPEASRASRPGEGPAAGQRQSNGGVPPTGRQREDNHAHPPPPREADEAPKSAIDAAGILAALTYFNSTLTERDIAAEVHKHTGGGGADPWMMQTGGYTALSEVQQQSAGRSYEDWAARKPELAARHGLEDYVSYVQERQVNRQAEQPERKADTADAKAAFDRLMAEVMAHRDLVKLGKPDEQGSVRFTTKDQLRAELRMEKSAEVLAGRRGHRVRDALRDAAPSATELGDAQRRAFNHITAAGDLACVIGYAGTGKSKLFKAGREAWVAGGYTVIGAAPSGIAAQELQKGSGIESRTTHSLLWRLENGKLNLTGSHILVLDEAGMIGSRQMSKILSFAAQAGAKVVASGDNEQIQSVEAGGAYRFMVKAHGAIEIDEVWRHKIEWQREATKKFGKGETADALRDYHDNKRIHAAASTDDAKDRIMTAWNTHRHERPGETQIILGYTNVDVDDLNQRARAEYRKEGKLGDDVQIQTAKKGKVSFASGDRLCFTDGDSLMGVKNGTIGTIEQIKGCGMRVRLDEGRVVEFDTHRYNNLALAYAATTHKTQGITVDHAHVLASKYMDSHAAYVSLSRQAKDVNMHYSTEEFRSFEHLSKRLSRQRPKDTALDYLNDREQTRSLRDALREMWNTARDVFSDARAKWQERDDAEVKKTVADRPDNNKEKWKPTPDRPTNPASYGEGSEKFRDMLQRGRGRTSDRGYDR